MPASVDAPASCRLYLVTPPRLDDPRAFLAVLERAFAGGDVAALQLRLKEVDDATIAEAVRVLAPATRAAGAALILNDRPDLAAALDCDGVHVGQTDAPYAAARAALGPDRIVGVTCHASLDLGFGAAEAGADYVAFGAFYPTSTKVAETHAELELLEGWQSHMPTPCVAIGGVTVATAREVARAGADFVAVSAGVWAYPQGPDVAVSRLVGEIRAGVTERSR